MPVVQSLISHDELFQEVRNKILLNNISLTNMADVKDKIYTIYEKDISLIPQCSCGYYKGEYLKGEICPRCKEVVTSVYDELKPVFWVYKFREDLPFINPKFWAMLSRVIYKNLDALRYLADTNYNPKNKPPIFEHLKILLGGRGYKKVVNNLEKIILYLLSNSSYKTKSKRDKLNLLLKIYREEKDKIFSNYLPLFDRKLFVMEKDIRGNFTSHVLSDAIDIATDIVLTVNSLDVSERKLENKTGKLISSIATLFTKYLTEFVAKKGGLLRRNIYGSRSHFTFRYVISSLDPRYDYDIIRVPWEVGPVVFRPHLLGKLLRRGFSLKEAQKLLDKSVKHYHPLLDELMQELIDESPYKGIPCLANRNPSLGKGSIHLVYITEFKKDPEETTVDLSVLIAPSLNADYDGAMI